MGSQSRQPRSDYQGKNGDQSKQVAVESNYKWMQVSTQITDHAVHTGEHHSGHDHVKQAFDWVRDFNVHSLSAIDYISQNMVKDYRVGKLQITLIKEDPDRAVMLPLLIGSRSLMYTQSP
jgi:hypothetical protein